MFDNNSVKKVKRKTKKEKEKEKSLKNKKSTVNHKFRKTFPSKLKASKPKVKTII